MTWTRGEKYLGISFVIGVVTTSTTCFVTTIAAGPFALKSRRFTYSLLVYPIFLVAALTRRYPLRRITGTALLFGFTTFAHVYFETPFDQYRT